MDAQEVSSNLGKGVGRRRPTVVRGSGGGTGSAAAGRGVPPAGARVWQATRARKSSYGSSGGGGGGISFSDTVFLGETTEEDWSGVDTSWTGPDRVRVDGTEAEVDEEVDRPSDVLGPFVTGDWTDEAGASSQVLHAETTTENLV